MIQEIYRRNADYEAGTDDDYSDYDYDEHSDDRYSAYPYENDDDDTGDYDDYYQVWGWRYRWRQLWYKIYWWHRRNFTHCGVCKQRSKNCQCLPF